MLSDLAQESSTVTDRSPKDNLQHRQLHNWYLARLRRLALGSDRRKFTPAQLIQADQSSIEELVLRSAQSTAESRLSEWLPALSLSNFAVIAAGSFVAVFAYLIVRYAGDLQQSLAVAGKLIFGSLIFQGPEHELFLQLGWAALALPLFFYGLPFAVILLTGACLKERSRQASIWYLWHDKQTYLRQGLSALLGLVPIALAAALLIQTGPAAPASDNVWHFTLTLSVWVISLGTIFLYNLQTTLTVPLASFADQLAVVLDKSMTSRQGSLVSLTALLAECIQSREEYRNREILIAQSAPELLVMFDAAGNLSECNNTALNLLSYLPEELHGRKLEDMVLPEDFSATREAFAAALSGNGPSNFIARLLTKQQKAIDLSWTLEWSTSEACVFGCARDITDQKTLERARRDFVSMLGHDIRTPLTSASFSLQLMENGMYGELPEAAGPPLSMVLGSVKRLESLLDELLDFEKLSAGKMKLELTTIELQKLVETACAEVTGQATQRSIVLATNEILELKLVGDFGRLVRVLINLLSNAIKFSPERGTVTVSTTLGWKDTLEIKVSDQGIGIPPEYQNLIFERYERLHTENEAQGTGLGLAIAKAIVESHNGMIGVTSEPGKGSTFWLTIPVQRPVNEQQ